MAVKHLSGQPDETGNRKKVLKETKFDPTLDYLTYLTPCEVPEDFLTALDELVDDWVQDKISSYS